MTAAALRRDPGNVFNALAKRARRSSGASLIALEITGLMIALAVWIWAPDRWQVALPFLALSAFGLWGVVDKVIASGGRRMDPLLRVILRSLRFLVAAAGVIAAAATGYLIVGQAIGTVVS